MREPRECAATDCDVMFIPKTHNMVFCCAEHCRTETNRRIMENYYEDKARRSGKSRVCKKCKTNKLSRYNDSKTCYECQTASQSNIHTSLYAMVSNVQWVE